MIEGVVYQGAIVAVPGLHVVDGRTTGRWWYEGDRGVRKSRVQVRAFDIHHTGGEGGPARVFATLKGRGLSTSFTIDRDGAIEQHADLDLVTYDSGAANAWSRGAELISRGVPPAHPNSPRAIYTAWMHGRERRFLEFYPAQVESCRALARAVCRVFGIPWRFPMDGRGQILTRSLTVAEMHAFTGILGHFHISPVKTDPGIRILEQLAGIDVPTTYQDVG